MTGRPTDLRDRLPSDDRELLAGAEAFLRPLGARCYLVGGAVRDAVMGRSPREYDIEVYGLAPESFDAAMTRFGASGVGKSFFVYRKGKLDLSLPRTERKSAAGHRGFDVAVTQDPREACRRRDFTVNAMMLSLANGELTDFFGGQEDIRQGILRMVDAATFGEDSLRVLRAMQFAARLGFAIDPKTVETCRSIDMNDLSPARIYDEFVKMGRGDRTRGLEMFFRLGIAGRFYGIGGVAPPVSLLARMKELETCALSDPLIPFFYLFKEVYHLSCATLTAPLAPPKRLCDALGRQKRVPRRVTDRFLAAMATVMPLSQWCGGVAGHITRRAVELGLWDDLLECAPSAAEAMARGCRGPQIGRYIKDGRTARLKQYKGRE